MRDAFSDKGYLQTVEDLIYHPEVLKLKGYRHHKVNNRYRHSIEVSYLTYRMALKLKLKADEVARGALLHDLYYYDTCIKEKEEYNKHLTTHPVIALHNASKISEITPIMKDMILTHMYYGSGKHPKPRYRESWCLVIADKLATLDDGGEFLIYAKEFSKVIYKEKQRLTLEEYSLKHPVHI